MADPLTLITAGTALYGAAKGGGSKQTSSTQVDPAQMAMYQDLYGRAKGCTTTICSIHRITSCWF
jgi:hypothetical protein